MQMPDVTFYEDTAELERVIERFAGLFVAFVVAMLVFGCLMAFAIIFTTMSLNVVERRREMAMLRCGGMTDRTIASLVTGENFLVTTLGIVPGLALGVLVARTFMNLYTNDQLSLPLMVNPITLAVSGLAVLAAAGLSQWPGLRAARKLDLAAVVRERSE